MKEQEKEITSEFLSNFYYDETSPTGLRWRTQPHPRIKVGSIAGSISSEDKRDKSRSLVRLKPFGKFVCSRVVWTIHNGEIPKGMSIDHLDGDPWNNKIENLACKSHAENMRNCKKRKHNASGFTGVRWVVFKDYRYTYAEGTCVIDGKKVTKKFSVAKFGLLPAFKMAVLWRMNKMKELNSLGLNYTNRHISGESNYD